MRGGDAHARAPSLCPGHRRRGHGALPPVDRAGRERLRGLARLQGRARPRSTARAARAGACCRRSRCPTRRSCASRASAAGCGCTARAGARAAGTRSACSTSSRRCRSWSRSSPSRRSAARSSTTSAGSTPTPSQRLADEASTVMRRVRPLPPARRGRGGRDLGLARQPAAHPPCPISHEPAARRAAAFRALRLRPAGPGRDPRALRVGRPRRRPRGAAGRGLTPACRGYTGRRPLPGGVIGSTPDSGSGSWGSSPCPAVAVRAPLTALDSSRRPPPGAAD